MKSFTMNQQQTVAILATVIAVAALAIAPVAISSASAAPNGDTKTTCVHNGNGAGKCGPGNSSTEVTCVKTNGKYVCSSS
jgi:uncharacterized low-complexity protein